MHDQPTPTPEEQEQGPERRADEEAMRQAGHDDPPDVLDEDELPGA